MFPHIKDDILEQIKPIHRKFRTQKADLFVRIVGGGAGVDREFLDLYSRFAEVVVVNLAPEVFEAPPAVRLQSMLADGRCLPFGSASFEWVFSNAVIEHVGGWEDQLRFAQEIRRVAARGYFVTTPNRYFPLEPHTLLPFYQFLPVSLQRRVAPYSPGYLRQYEEINLLTSAQMRKLFPEAKIGRIGFPVFGNSLVAHYRKA